MARSRGQVQQYVLIAAGLLCFVVAAVLLHAFKGKFGQEAVQQTSLPAMEDTIDVSASDVTSPERQQTAGPKKADVWVVYITGAVKNPGVYEVPAEARIYQALDAAGGFTGQADRDAVNLAAPLSDGTHVRFPAKGEKKEPDSAPSPQNNSRYESPAQSEPSVKLAHKIDLNKCTSKELEEVPGIGPKTAQLILQYREKEGGFRRVEDLLLVSGIGPKKYELLKDYVVVVN